MQVKRVMIKRNMNGISVFKTEVDYEDLAKSRKELGCYIVVSVSYEMISDLLVCCDLERVTIDQ